MLAELEYIYLVLFFQGSVDWAGTAVGMCPALFTDEDKAWGRSRRLVAPPFSGHNVRTMVPAMVKVRAYTLSLTSCV